MKKFFALALAAITSMPLSAQDKIEAQDEITATISTDLVSHYMWRGIDMAGPSIQPELNVAWKGLSLDITGNAPFDKEDLKEINTTLGYSLFGFNIGVTDYWTADVDPRNRFFYYGGEAECPHQLEANIGYSCKYGSLQAYTMVYGNDYKIDGSRAYSTYIELSVPFNLGGLNWDIRAGVTPMESAGTTYQEKVVTETGGVRTVTRGDWYYGESFTCNMASVRATKKFMFKHFNLPVFVELHTNPYLQRANLLFGITICSL